MNYEIRLKKTSPGRKHDTVHYDIDYDINALCALTNEEYENFKQEVAEHIVFMLAHGYKYYKKEDNKIELK